jgi:hypothetical protein
VPELAADAPGRRRRQGAGGACRGVPSMAWSACESTHGKICGTLDSWEQHKRRHEPCQAGCAGKQQGRRRHARARYRLYTRCIGSFCYVRACYVYMCHEEITSSSVATHGHSTSYIRINQCGDTLSRAGSLFVTIECRREIYVHL